MSDTGCRTWAEPLSCIWSASLLLKLNTLPSYQSKRVFSQTDIANCSNVFKAAIASTYLDIFIFGIQKCAGEVNRYPSGSIQYDTEKKTHKKDLTVHRITDWQWHFENSLFHEWVQWLERTCIHLTWSLNCCKSRWGGHTTHTKSRVNQTQMPDRGQRWKLVGRDHREDRE